MPGIAFEDWTFIQERLHAGGNIKEIRLYLSQAKKRQERKSFKEKQTLIQQQTQGNLQMAQETQKTKAMESNMKTQGQIAVDNNKGAIDYKLEMLKINGNYVAQLEKQQAQEQQVQEQE